MSLETNLNELLDVDLPFFAFCLHKSQLKNYLMVEWENWSKWDSDPSMKELAIPSFTLQKPYPLLTKNELVVKKICFDAAIKEFSSFCTTWSEEKLKYFYEFWK